MSDTSAAARVARTTKSNINYSAYRPYAATRSESSAAASTLSSSTKDSKFKIVNPYRPVASPLTIQNREILADSLRRSNRIQELNQRKLKSVHSMKMSITTVTPTANSTPRKSTVSRPVTAKTTPRTNQLKRKIQELELKERSIKQQDQDKQYKNIENQLPSYDDPDGHYRIVPGEIVAGEFKIYSLLGQGTFGKVVKVESVQHKKWSAIKIIKSIQKYRKAAESEIKILEHIKRCDPYMTRYEMATQMLNYRNCIELLSVFDYRNHICMVFHLYSQSVFDFMKENKYFPFPLDHIKDFTLQMLQSVEFVHSLSIIHTDLKPENLMLIDNSYRQVAISKNSRDTKRQLLCTDIKLIDFGSAVISGDHHSSVVSTRHYRAPEIILGLGWSFPCDMWSIGCMLVEFFTGDALFQTHHNLEHLAIMEKILGPIPKDLSRTSNNVSQTPFFTPSLDLNVPNDNTNGYSKKFISTRPTLRETITPTCELEEEFLDLVAKMLEYNPDTRITATQALEHRFLQY